MSRCRRGEKPWAFGWLWRGLTWVCISAWRVAHRAGCRENSSGLPSTYTGSRVADRNVKADRWPPITSHYPQGFASEEMLRGGLRALSGRLDDGIQREENVYDSCELQSHTNDTSVVCSHIIANMPLVPQLNWEQKMCQTPDRESSPMFVACKAVHGVMDSSAYVSFI